MELGLCGSSVIECIRFRHIGVWTEHPTAADIFMITMDSLNQRGNQGYSGLRLFAMIGRDHTSEWMSSNARSLDS